MCTPKQNRFAEEYIIDLNATQAAIRAGYSPNTANEQGARLLTKVSVQTEIQSAIEARSRRTEITADKVLAELAKIAFANMQDYMTVNSDGSAYMDLSSLTREQAAAIQELNCETYTEQDGDTERPVKKARIKLTDKRGALVDVGKHLGMFTEKLQHEGTLEIVVRREPTDGTS